MNFHNTAIKYAQLAAAAVDSRGHLLHQVGSYPAGTVRDAELAELEQAYRSTVIAEVEHRELGRVDKGERVDRPGAVIFDFGLVCTKHPMAGLVHFQDDRTGWADIGLDSPQGRCEGGNCGQARLGERY